MQEAIVVFFRQQMQSKVIYLIYILDHIKDWYLGREDTNLSMGVLSNGEYGISAGLCFSYPIKCLGNFKY